MFHALAEIGADFVEKAMVDEATAKRIIDENRTLAGHILERIRDAVAAFKAKRNMSAEE